ncbi:unnamed protein product [Caenorhabditis sp. 36 PRJEB53466]|nr:unnamed protein product [Caenorhabditis sp. 36 PRJEB53466]
MFDEQLFERLLNNVRANQDISSSLRSLKHMDIPRSYSENSDLIAQSERLLHTPSHWLLAMKVIRKMEVREPPRPDEMYAPKLRESDEMRQIWRDSRLRRIEDDEYLKDYGRRRAEDERMEKWWKGAKGKLDVNGNAFFFFNKRGTRGAKSNRTKAAKKKKKMKKRREEQEKKKQFSRKKRKN